MHVHVIHTNATAESVNMVAARPRQSGSTLTGIVAKLISASVASKNGIQ